MGFGKIIDELIRRVYMNNMNDDLWIFAYGSLIWNPGFDYLERRVGYVEGWVRKFHQSSDDHRGQPSFPGRVVTLESSNQEVCWGIAFC